MARIAFKVALIAGITALSATASTAQFGSIFGEPPPRPPGSVPGGNQQMPPPPQDYSYPPSSPTAPQGYPQSRQYPPQNGPYGPSSGVQSRPLPPPPGTPVSRPPARQPAVTAAPPAQRQPRTATQPTAANPPPADEEIVAPPPERIANPTAVFSGLDKITGRIIKFDVAIGETVQFGALQLTTRACYTRPPTEQANTDAFVEVDEVTLKGEVRRIFTGWMFAASPGLHAVEHPIYDLWLTDCKGGSQAVAADTTAPDSSAAKTRPAAQARTPQRRPQRPQQRQSPQQSYPPYR
jgi:hypothetical protein